MFGQLIPAGGGLPIPLLKETVILGRARGCDVVVPSNAVSSRHCQLTRKDGHWWVIDLDSRNGTGVNGVRVRRRMILPNETLCMPKMRFRLVYDAPHADPEVPPSSDDSLAMRALSEPEMPVTPESATTRSTVIEEDTAGIISLPRSEPESVGKPSRLTRLTKQKSEPDPKPKPEEADVAEKPVRRYLGKLVPCGGGDPIPLLQPSLLIGRSRQADIRLKYSTVSGRHCTLSYEDGYWFVEDLSSSNGVRINGERVDRRHLVSGDQLSISSQRFTIEYIPEGPPPVDPSLFSKSLLEKAGLQNVITEDHAPSWITSHEEHEDDAPRRYKLDESDPD